MNKAEAKFYRDKKQDIDIQAREKNPMWPKFMGISNSNPIFIPKKKKKK